jgi:hypothetical protein
VLEDYSYPRLLLAGLAGTLAITLIVLAGTSSASLGVYNADWDGTAEIRSAAESAGAEPTVVQNVSAYEAVPPEQTLAVVLSPSDAYGRDGQAVRSFVRSGGTLLVAEDYGQHGNQLLDGVGGDARINGTPLRDEQRAGPSPAFPRANPVTNHTYTDGVDGLMLNHGSTIDAGNATTLFASSEFSYLDTNRNGALDEAETLRQRPVVTIESVGEGRVIVVSDPSVFLNSMLDRSDNAAFLQALVESHDRVVLDVSHSTSPPPLVTARLLLQDSGVAAFFVGALSVLVVTVALQPIGIVRRLRERRSGRPDSPGLSETDIAASLRRRHPEWDSERIERVTDSLMERRGKGESND